MLYYISHGKLYQTTGQEAIEHTSTFIQEKNEAREKAQAAKGYLQKEDQSEGHSANPFNIWGKMGQPAAALSAEYMDVRESGAYIFYIIRFGASVGLFRYDPETKTELRIFHRNGMEVLSFDIAPDMAHIVFAVKNEDGSSDLYLGGEEARIDERITSGDSFDIDPVFSDNNTVLFSSAGIGRNAAGQIIDRLAFSVQSIHIETKAVEQLAQESATDLVAPCMYNGKTISVRKPFHSLTHVPMWRRALQVVLFPFYLVVAIFGFFQGFIRLFAKNDYNLIGPNISVPKTRPALAFGELVQKQNQKTGDWEIPEKIHVSAIDKSNSYARGISAYSVAKQDNLCIARGRRVYLGDELIHHADSGSFITKLLYVG